MLPGLRKRGKKAFGPMFDIMDQEMLEHGAMAFAPLGQRHFQCALQRRCHGLAIVRIDDQRSGEFRSRAGELREDEHSRILPILRRDIFLGDEVHALPKGRNQRHIGCAVDAGERGA